MARKFNYPGSMFLTASTILLSALFGTTGQTSSRDTYRDKPSLSGATGWLNTQPLNLADLRGKVVLIDFWTYTCINWRRTLPYIREWARKYKDQGLVVIGIHTPEFSFEQKWDNVSSAIRSMDIGYPVAADNNFEIWRSFDNQYWPALYLIDAKGKIRYQKFGEGDYEASEKMIQQLLKGIASNTVPDNIATPLAEGYEAAADWQNIGSPESYFGYDRAQGFASPGKPGADKPVSYMLPKKLLLNEWALSGAWTIGKERILSNSGTGKLVYRFHARDLHLVMGPATPGKAIKFRVLIDGLPPDTGHGVDIDPDGNGTVTEQRMYQLIRQQGTITDRELQIEFVDPGVEVFNITFG